MLLQRHLAVHFAELAAEVQILAAGPGGAILPRVHLEGGVLVVLGLFGVHGPGGHGGFVAALQGGLEFGSERELDEADAFRDDLVGPVFMVLDVDVLELLVFGRVPGVQLLPVVGLHQLVLLRHQEKRRNFAQIGKILFQLVIFQRVACLLVELVADEGHQRLEEALRQTGSFRSKFFDQLSQILERAV